MYAKVAGAAAMRHPLLDRLDPADEAAMRELIGGAMRTQAVYVVTRLGIPDLLGGSPATSASLAQRSGVDADALQRVMRYLAANGVFEERADGTFALTRAGEYLQKNHPRSMALSAIRAGEGFWKTLESLREVVERGQLPHATAFFDEITSAERDAAFAARMSASSARLGTAIADAEPFAAGETVVDVGGGIGLVVAEIVRRHRDVRGVVFDRAATVDVAKQHAPQDVAIELVAGDFFERVPPADAYVLSWVLHDWSDEDALRILASCRKSSPQARLLIVEVARPERAQKLEAPAQLADPFTLDLQMLLLTGGRERTIGEYAALLDRAGYALKKQTLLSTARGASLIVATPQSAASKASADQE